MYRNKNDETDNNISLNDFISGKSVNTDFIEKIKFSSPLDYYNYYLGLDCLIIDNELVNKMVESYITGLEWCLNYYLNECKSWSWSYGFIIAPLIYDLIKYCPKNITILQKKRELNPVEQLILAIPPYTYKYVIESDIINNVIKQFEIGYMFPKSFMIDINKESVYWKCQVKIPQVDYEIYLKVIKNLNIVNEKNI
jgi:5'-3' exoribonuclease 1